MDNELADMLAANVLDGGRSDTSDVPALPITDDKGSLQALAFGIWAYDAGRDMSLVQSILAERTGMTVGLSQLRGWRDASKWGESVGVVHQALLTEATSTTRSMLGLATVKAVRTLVRVMDDPSVSAATQVKAAMTVLDRANFPVLMRGEMMDPIHLARNSEYAELSNDDLEATYREFNIDDSYTERGVVLAGEMNAASIHYIGKPTPHTR